MIGRPPVFILPQQGHSLPSEQEMRRGALLYQEEEEREDQTETVDVRSVENRRR